MNDVNEMMDQLSDMLEVMNEHDRLFPMIAKTMRRLYNELIAAGFSEEEATRIVANYKATGN